MVQKGSKSINRQPKPEPQAQPIAQSDPKMGSIPRNNFKEKRLDEPLQMDETSLSEQLSKAHIDTKESKSQSTVSENVLDVSESLADVENWSHDLVGDEEEEERAYIMEENSKCRITQERGESQKSKAAPQISSDKKMEIDEKKDEQAGNMKTRESHNTILDDFGLSDAVESMPVERSNLQRAIGTALECALGKKKNARLLSLIMPF